VNDLTKISGTGPVRERKEILKITTREGEFFQAMNGLRRREKKGQSKLHVVQKKKISKPSLKGVNHPNSTK